MSLRASCRLSRGSLSLDVDLQVGANETVALVGPNGAGKTTLLHAIAGLLHVDHGRIEFGGEVVDGGPSGAFVPPERRGVGCLFQEHRLFPHLTALDNVAFGLRARGVGRAAARVTALEWLRRVGVAEHAASLPRALSGGQAQRVALARALAPSPLLLLLDEPLAAVDVSARTALRRDLREHLGAFAGPRVVVTHDVIDAFVLADRIVVMEAGRIVQVGTAADIGSRPKSRFVADLVGLNCFRGIVQDSVLELANGARVVVVSDQGGPAVATVHPRSIALFPQQPSGSPRNTWRAPVLAIEPAQGSVRVCLGGDVPVVAEVTPAAVSGLHLRPGVEVWVAIKATEIQVVAE